MIKITLEHGRSIRKISLLNAGTVQVCPSQERLKAQKTGVFYITDILEYIGKGQSTNYRVKRNNSDIEWVERSRLDPFPTVRLSYEIHCRRERQKISKKKASLEHREPCIQSLCSRPISGNKPNHHLGR